jgi:ferric-dicitrate binding protein FerR (iron transport regulator)
MKDDFSILTSKALAGEADEQEKTLLRQMLQDEEDGLLYNRIKEYWDADVSPEEYLSADVKDRLQQRILADRQLSARRSFILYFYRAAVIALLVLSGGTWLYYRTHAIHTYTYATQNAPADYVLQDGTKVKLNKNSSITFRAGFGEKERTLSMTGEAFLNVRKDARKPFTVCTQGTKTTVLGTKFNILSDGQRRQVAVTLQDGAVRFEANNCNVTLSPQEELVYQTASGSYAKSLTDSQYNTAWTEGRYLYQNIPFGELTKKLEHIYGLTIRMNSPELAGRNVTASFVIGQPVDEILSALKKELSFKYTITDLSIIDIVKK